MNGCTIRLSVGYQRLVSATGPTDLNEKVCPTFNYTVHADIDVQWPTILYLSSQEIICQFMVNANADENLSLFLFP